MAKYKCTNCKFTKEYNDKPKCCPYCQTGKMKEEIPVSLNDMISSVDYDE